MDAIVEPQAKRQDFAQDLALVEEVSLEEAVRLGAVDSEFYSHYFFPKAFRQQSPSFQRLIWNGLEDPRHRLFGAKIFRGGSKTTLARVFTSKRIAYGISKTILYVGPNEAAAIRSTRWLKNQVERNSKWAKAFGLEKGGKWQEHEFEILQKLPGDEPRTIWVLAVGINGNIRGINFDDYRPDLIVLDDVLDDENCQTEEQRMKLIRLIMGALKEGLAPRIDEANAKLVALWTPQHVQDPSVLADKDPEWDTLTIGCWTPETADLSVDQQESAWEERIPTDELRAEKRAAMIANRLSVWVREKECRLTSPEENAFRSFWLKIDDDPPLDSYNVLAIDPVPPPSDREMAKGLAGKNFEAHVVWGRREDSLYCHEAEQQRGHEPNWTISTAFALAQRFRVAFIIVEAVAYQRTLKWLLEQEMKRRGIYFPVIPVNDKRAKFTRIVGAIAGPASQGLIHVRSNQTALASQFYGYGPSYADDDDLIDASSMAINFLMKSAPRIAAPPDDQLPEFPAQRGCP